MSQAKYEILIGHFTSFHAAMMVPSNRGISRLMIGMLTLLGSYEDCPIDVAQWIEDEIGQIYDAACGGRVIPLRVPGVVYTVDDDDNIIVDCLRSSLVHA